MTIKRVNLTGNFLSDFLKSTVLFCPQGTEFTDNNVHEGKAYEYRVSAVNAAGTGRASDASDVIIARTMKGKNIK